MDQKYKILIVAGGTGGHVMPALAVAQYFIEHGHQVHWLGTRTGIEQNLVPKHNIPISYIQISGLRGKSKAALFQAPFKIFKAIIQSIKILRTVKPDVVLTMGGYVSGPAGIAAWLRRTPLVVHEQNAIAGMTNRILAHFARRVCLAYPNELSRAKGKAIVTGNPIRKMFVESQINFDSVPEKPLKVLVFGGSQGALKLNQVIPQAFALFTNAQRPQIWHQTGHNHLDITITEYEKLGVEAQIEPFIDDMLKAYQWADVVICRAGALTVAEVSQMAKPCIFIPFPAAVDDHQTENARFLSEQNGAYLLQQADLTPERLKALLEKLDNPDLRAEMARNAKRLSQPQATQKVAEQCFQVMASRG